MDHDLKALAAALEDALWQHIGKPIWPDRRGSAKCETPRAWVNYSGVAVKLHSLQGEADTLNIQEAQRYLAWLTAGNFGHHWYVENSFLNGEAG